MKTKMEENINFSENSSQNAQSENSGAANSNQLTPLSETKYATAKKSSCRPLLSFLVGILLVLASMSGTYFFMQNKKNGTKTTAALPVLQQNVSESDISSGEISGASSSFSAPYPIVWEDADNTPNMGGGGKFSLTSAYIGKFQLSDVIIKTAWDGFSNQGYSAGQEINAVVLGFKINVNEGGFMPRNIRRISIDSTGNKDKFPPINQDFIYPGHKPMNDFFQADSTIDNAKIIFDVPENESRYIFSTGGSDDKTFELVVNNNQVEIKTDTLDMSDPDQVRLKVVNFLRSGDVESASKYFMPENQKFPLLLQLNTEDRESLATMIEKGVISEKTAHTISFKYLSGKDLKEFEMGTDGHDNWFITSW